jgi:general secretion pathway protein K
MARPDSVGLAAAHLEREPVMSQRPIQQSGAVLLLSLLLVAMVSALIASTIWRRSQQVQIETLERQRQQGAWLLQGATDWARLILREDARNSNADHLSEPWAVPLQESRLSTFLAQQPGLNASTQDLAWTEQVMLSGGIEDAQGKFNLANLVQGQRIDPRSSAELARLYQLLGLPTAQASGLARQVLLARRDPPRVLWPRHLEDLRAWGIDEASLARLRPHVVILPERTVLNVNTASPEVLAAVLDGVDLSQAQRWAQSRLRSPWQQTDQARQALGPAYDDNRHAIGSAYFLIHGQLRTGAQRQAQTALVKRDGSSVVYVWVSPTAPSVAP